MTINSASSPGHKISDDGKKILLGAVTNPNGGDSSSLTYQWSSTDTTINNLLQDENSATLVLNAEHAAGSKGVGVP